MNFVAKASTIDLSVSELADGIAATSVNPVTVIDDVLERIDEIDAKVHAWAYLDADGARATAAAMAAEANAGKLRGPLHGVPIGIKDVFHADGMPTLANSKTMDPAARYPDSGVVAALRRAGAIILGKTETVEFAGAGVNAETRNPWNLDHTPGGSSSGSGAAVGARMVPAAIGTQTGGSNLRPAAYCGVAGFKPTYGGLSRKGLLSFSWSLDHPGIIARSAVDLGLIYRAIAKRPPAKKDADRPWRAGLLRPFFLEQAQPPMVAAIEAAAKLFAEAGATISEPALPELFSTQAAVHRLIMTVEAAPYHAWRVAEKRDTMAEKHRISIEAASLIPATYYLQALRIRRQIKAGLEALFKKVDVLIMPTAPGGAPEGITSTGDAMFLSPWNLVGFPAATVPCGVGPDGMPLGIQIVGPPDGDGTVLAAAEFAEGLLGRLTLPP